MKFIIKENKIDDYIYSFIDKNLMDEELSIENNFLNSKYKNVYGFFGKSFDEDKENDPFFEFVEKDFYDEYDELYEKAPFLLIHSTNLFKKFYNLFGERYREQFKLWFENNYPQYKVKTYSFARRV